MQQTIASHLTSNPIIESSLSPAKTIYEHSSLIVLLLVKPIVPVMVNKMDQFIPNDLIRMELAYCELILERKAIARQKLAEIYNRMHEISLYLVDVLKSL